VMERAQEWQLNVDDPSNTKQVQIQQPRAVACYAKKDGEAVLRMEDAMKCLAEYRDPPTLPADLCDGFPERYKVKDDSTEKGGMSLRAALGAITTNAIELRGVSVVSFRNNFNKIMGTPYNMKDPWAIDVWREGPLLVFSVVHLESDSRSSDETSLPTYWGFKFEQYCTVGEDTNTAVVNPNDEFAVVVRAKVGQHRLVLSAEMDCTLKHPQRQQPLQGPPLMDLMVELKTSRQIDHPKMKFTFERYKMLSWWIQSFLAGVPRITVGWRDDTGDVMKVEHLPTMKLPKLANADILKWDFRVCLGFTQRVLDWVAATTQDGTRYRLSYTPQKGEASSVKLAVNPEPCFLSEEERAQLRALTGSAEPSREAPQGRNLADEGGERPTKRPKT